MADPIIRCQSLLSHPEITGRVVFANSAQEYTAADGEWLILVYDNGDPENYSSMAFSRRASGGRVAVLLEVGGASCHLAITGRENDIPMMVLPNAKQILSDGEIVKFNAVFGIIQKLKNKTTYIA